MPDRIEEKNKYQAEVYTQLVLHGLSHQAAAERSKEAADFLWFKELPFPTIVVG